MLDQYVPEDIADFTDEDAAEFLEFELGCEPAMCGLCGFVCSATRICEGCGSIVND